MQVHVHSSPFSPEKTFNNVFDVLIGFTSLVFLKVYSKIKRKVPYSPAWLFNLPAYSCPQSTWCYILQTMSLNVSIRTTKVFITELARTPDTPI